MFALSELVDSDDGGAVRTSIGQVAAACHCHGSGAMCAVERHLDATG